VQKIKACEGRVLIFFFGIYNGRLKNCNQNFKRKSSLAIYKEKKKKLPIFKSKFTSINIHCKQRCSFQAFIHILEIVIDHDLHFIHLLKTNSFFNFTFFEHGIKVKQ
jgi:hypothetical protein